MTSRGRVSSLVRIFCAGVLGPAAVWLSISAFPPAVNAAGQTEGPITAPSTQPAPPDSTSAPADARPNLAGEWKFNKKQSDDPREKMREAMENAGPRRRGWGAGMDGRPYGGGWGVRRSQRGGMMDPADLSQLTIDQAPDRTQVSDAHGRILALYSADESANPRPSDGFSRTPPPARWQNGRLVVVMEGFRGGKTTRTYSLSPDGRQLYLTTRIENPRFQQPLTMRFVYDRAKSGSR